MLANFYNLLMLFHTKYKSNLINGYGFVPLKLKNNIKLCLKCFNNTLTDITIQRVCHKVFVSNKKKTVFNRDLVYKKMSTSQNI